MEQSVALLAISSLASKVLEFIKYLRNKDWNAAVTLLALWASGIVTVLVAAATDITERLVLPQTDTPLVDLSGGSKVFLGLILTSLISYAYDFKKAFDRTDSAKQPPLIGPETDPVVTHVH